MGGFYGSVQIKTVDRDEVRRLAEAVFTQRGIKGYLGPALNGWVGVYPQDNGQDTTVGQAIAAGLTVPVLHLIVHDDDVFAYQLWRGSEELDWFWSRPGYFGEDERPMQEAAVGRPEVLGEVFGCPIEAMRELLQRDERVLFEFERLTKFASLLGIPNAVTAYEYLEWGERDNVRGWKRFEELPASAIADERQAKQERRKQITAGRKSLKKAGKLLAEKTFRGYQVGGHACGESGFVVLMSRGVTGQAELWTPPWTTKSRKAVAIDGSPYAAAASADGSRIAFASASGMELIDCGTWQRVYSNTAQGMLLGLSLSGDLLVMAERANMQLAESQLEVRVIRVADGETIATTQVAEAIHAAISPDGEWCVLAGSGLNFLRIPGAAPAVQRFVGGMVSMAGVAEIFDRVNLKELKAASQDQEAKLEQTLEQVMAMVQKGAGPRLSDAEQEEVRDNLRRSLTEQFERMKSTFEALERGELPPSPPQGKEKPFKVGFAGKGRWLWCATDMGMRVYEWPAVVSMGDELPQPIAEYSPAAIHESGMSQSYVYAVVEAADDELVFGGLNGVVYRMRLPKGEVTELLSPPAGGAILQMAMSADKKALGVMSIPGFPNPDGGAKQANVWEVWSYANV
jgi:hypothetical protein